MNLYPMRIKIISLGAPLHAAKQRVRYPLKDGSAIMRFWRRVIAREEDHEEEKENLCVILVDVRMRVLAWNRVALGSVNECVSHPREIFRPAVIVASSGFIIVHNHPSGDPTPSYADRRMTRSLRHGAELLQIRLLDHVIIGWNRWYSFRSAGMI